MVKKVEQKQSDEKINTQKSSTRISINIRLIAVAFTIFVFILATKTEILTASKIATLQLVLAIPFLLSSTFARSKLCYSNESKKWDNFGWFTFIVGYAFLINVVGILISIYVSLLFGIIFFVVNAGLTSIYSAIDLSHSKETIMKRIGRDFFFIILLIALGVLPSLGLF
jgi:hypothetical protein